MAGIESTICDICRSIYPGGFLADLQGDAKMPTSSRRLCWSCWRHSHDIPISPVPPELWSAWVTNRRHPDRVVMMSNPFAALPNIPFGKWQNLPTASGVYIALSCSYALLYVGVARNLQHRWRHTHHRVEELHEAGCWRLAWYLATTERFDIESALIQKYRPPLNTTIPRMTATSENIAALLPGYLCRMQS